MIKEKKHNVLVVLLLAVLFFWVKDLLLTPKNSLELHQKVTFANDFEEVQKLILDGYDDHVKEADFNYIKGRSANSVGQFTLIEYKEKSYVIMT